MPKVLPGNHKVRFEMGMLSTFLGSCREVLGLKHFLIQLRMGRLVKDDNPCNTQVVLAVLAQERQDLILLFCLINNIQQNNFHLLCVSLMQSNILKHTQHKFLQILNDNNWDQVKSVSYYGTACDSAER